MADPYDEPSYTPAITREQYWRTVNNQGHPLNWKPNHYAPIGAMGDDAPAPQTNRQRFRAAA